MKSKETFDETAKRFNKDEKTFICTEALRLFYQTENDEIALEALKLLESAAQLF